MSPNNMAILKSLVSVAWADGEVTDKEREMLEALIAAFDASDEQAREVRDYAREKKSLDDMPLDELSDDDCRVFLQHAVHLTYVDGTRNDAEGKLVADLCAKIGIADDQARDVISHAEARAKRYLNLL